MKELKEIWYKLSGEYIDENNSIYRAMKEAYNLALDKAANYAETKEELDFSDDVGTYAYRVVDKESILKYVCPTTPPMTDNNVDEPSI